MWKRGTAMVLSSLVALSIAAPVAAGGAKVDRIADFDTVLAVRMEDDFPLASLMRADCSRLIRVERPDGSSTEIQDCVLSDRQVMIPEFQGEPPSQAFVLVGGMCQWFSDYWFNTEGVDVLAQSFRYTVTPSGHVHVRSEYPAEPLVCE
jgi:hypothetical protein